jgi:hypothetical protein
MLPTRSSSRQGRQRSPASALAQIIQVYLPSP